MKNLFAPIGVAALLLATVIPAAAQVPTYAAQSISLPATVPATVVSNLPSSLQQTLDVRKQQNVSLEWTVSTSTAGALTNVALIFQKSVSGLNYDTNNMVVWQVNGLGSATPQTFVTNLTVAGYGYLKLVAVTNGYASGTITNSSGYYGVKISSP